MFFRANSATATVKPFGEKMGLVINVRANAKRQGDGTELMHVISRWADKQGWVLYLVPRIFERHGIPDNARLIEWYKTFGFELDPNVKRNRQMVRYPREKFTPSSEKDALPQRG